MEKSNLTLKRLPMIDDQIYIPEEGGGLGFARQI